MCVCLCVYFLPLFSYKIAGLPGEGPSSQKLGQKLSEESGVVSGGEDFLHDDNCSQRGPGNESLKKAQICAWEKNKL